MGTRHPPVDLESPVRGGRSPRQIMTRTPVMRTRCGAGDTTQVGIVLYVCGFNPMSRIFHNAPIFGHMMFLCMSVKSSPGNLFQ